MIFICKNVPSSTNFFISIVFNSFGHGNHYLVRSEHGFLGNPSFAFLFQLVSQIIFFVSWPVPIPVAMRSSLLDDVFWQ